MYSLSQLAAIYTIYKDLDKDTRIVKCCTCGKTLNIESIEDSYSYWGHYIPRSVEPKLKYHPNNAFAQCVLCNTTDNQNIQNNYNKYMQYRFGDDIFSKLKSDCIFNDREYAKNFYENELIKLAEIFPELINISDSNKNSNPQKDDDIIKQWSTYSKTYKQDLDELTRHYLKSESIEYERF